MLPEQSHESRIRVHSLIFGFASGVCLEQVVFQETGQ